MFHDDNSIIEQHACYYLTFNVVDWIDIFIRPVFKQIIVESLNHFIEKKGLTVHAWCLMSNHLHLIAQAKEGFSLSLLANEFKKFTTKIILEDIDAELEVRRNWIMKKFKEASTSLKLIDKFHVWQTPTNSVYIDLQNFDLVNEHLEYIHSNPVRDRIVTRAEDYLHSSARDYIGIKGLVNIRVLDEFEQSNFIIRHMSNYRR
ncbi:MAG TPA: transposase [Chitinophagaceae bacterium]|jgi:REP element-mobilizing transposase RayT|nr:transposase [Chitinophagaceae bacterium]